MPQNCILPERAQELRDLLEKGKIDSEAITKLLPEEKAAVKSILEDIVTEKLGIKVTPEEIAQISKMSIKIDETQKVLGTDLGNPAKLQENIDFWKAKKVMDDYLASKNPTHKLKIATGTAGKAAMLFSVKSPVLNIGSNIEVGFTEALSRRIANGQLRGTDNTLAVDYVKMVNKIYQETGYDVSRMRDVTDVGASGERVLGSGGVHSQGPGIYRAGVRMIAEDIVFKQLLGAPDVAFSSAHFADSVNLNAMKMAKGDLVSAKAMMNDAMRLEPQTMEGEILRSQGILDAETATWTNTTWASELTSKLRKVMNDATGDARIGDILFPFIKTPANVIATGADYAGLGAPKALYKAYKAFRSGDLSNPQVLQSISRDLVRSGLGITGAIMITSQLKDDDFVGAYDPARAQIEGLRNSNENSVRIHGKWISVDWFGPLAIPITAMMYSRKYGQAGWKERIFQYGKGIVSGISNLPVISDVAGFYKNISQQKNQDLKEMTGSTFDYITSQAYARLIPSFVSDIANATDSKQRQATTNLQSIQNKIPGLRNRLPEKKNVFNETVQGEPAWSDILFGSRLKTDHENSFIKEINRVSTAVDKGVNFTDWNKSSNLSLVQFKEVKGAKTYEDAKTLYGQKLKAKLASEIAKNTYQKLSDDDKYKLINGLDSTIIDEIFKKYGFKYKAKKK